MTWFAFVGLLLAAIIVVGAAGVATYDRLVVWVDRYKAVDSGVLLAHSRRNYGRRDYDRRNEATPVRPGVTVTRRDGPVAMKRDVFEHGYDSVWMAVTGPATLMTGGQGTKPAPGSKALVSKSPGSKSAVWKSPGSKLPVSKPGQGRPADLEGLAHVKVIRRSGA